MRHDEDHLRLLSIFHYVLAALVGLGALFPGIYLVIGLFLILAADKLPNYGQPPPPAFIGWFVVVVALIFITLACIFAVLLLITGRFLAQRRHHTFCLIIAGIECFFVPFGTVLGVLTLVLLLQEPVRLLFGGSQTPPVVR